MSRRFCLIIGAALGLAGCNMANSQDTQFDDARNPHYKQAQQDLDASNFAAAATEYEAALAASPNLSGAHYQLGVLYGEKLQDPVESIYHFKRFLQLAPNSDHAANARESIEKERQAFAASMPNPSAQNPGEIAKLQAEVTAQKKQLGVAAQTITKLQAQLAKASRHHPAAAALSSELVAAPAEDATAASAPAAPVAETATPAEAVVPANATPTAPPRALPLGSTNEEATAAAPETPAAETPAPNAGPSRSYTVVSGDTLTRIAIKMYPGHVQRGIQKMTEANRETLPDPARLKIGQVLIVPQ